MKKDRQPDWQDTNMSLFGSDIEKNIKAAAADGEPQWDGAGEKVGLQIWRIEQFKVKPWPRSKYGRFHEGDSYIILNTFVANPDINPDKLAWDIHFWIGSESTQDEYGTAAYKTVELDDKLGGGPVQHREVQGSESKLFMTYFPGRRVTYLAGGVDTGFNKVDHETHREAKLFEVKGRSDNIRLKEVKLKRDAMNSGDVYILDAEEAIYQWNGEGSNAHERAKAAEFAQSLKADRGGKVEIQTLEESHMNMQQSHPFWVHMPGEWKMLGITMGEIKVKTSEKGGDDERVTKFTPQLVRLQAYEGKVRVTRVARGEKLPISKLKTDDVFAYDTGFHVYLWVGKQAERAEKTSAFPFAQRYLKEYKRPSVLPITRYDEGKEAKDFLDLWGPPEKHCCVIL